MRSIEYTTYYLSRYNWHTTSALFISLRYSKDGDVSLALLQGKRRQVKETSRPAEYTEEDVEDQSSRPTTAANLVAPKGGYHNWGRQIGV